MATSEVTFKRVGHYCSVLVHGIAIGCAVCGIVVIVVAPLASVVYGIALFAAAIVLEVILAGHCPDNPHYRRRVSNPRSRLVRARKR